MGVCCAKDDDEGFDYVATQVVDLPLKADASPDESPEWNPKELQVILNNVLRRRSLFCDESPCLSDDGREVAQELAQVLEEYAHVGIIVRGYPSRSSINDNSPYESHQLGLERARAVRDFLAATCDCNIFAVEGEDHVDGRTAEVELEVCEAEEATVQQSESGVQQSDSGDDISSETADADEHCRSHTPQVVKTQGIRAPSWPLTGMPFLEMEFIIDQAGTKRSILFCQKPLGMEFWQRQPVKVTGFKQKSHAQELGVQKGWVLVSIGGQDVKSWKCNEVYSLLQDRVTILPDSER